MTCAVGNCAYNYSEFLDYEQVSVMVYHLLPYGVILYAYNYSEFLVYEQVSVMFYHLLPCGVMLHKYSRRQIGVNE